MPLPNTLIVGAPKCGTTFLAAWLARSADAFVPKIKETGFFSSQRQLARGLEHYSRTYYRGAEGKSVIVDATPWYLYPEAIPPILAASLEDDVRVLILLRDPVRRAVSMYYDQISRVAEERSFAQAVSDELSIADPARLLAECDVTELIRHYVLCGLYFRPVRRYLDTFGQSSVLVIRSEQLWSDPASVKVELDGFLGITLPEAPGRSANPASQPRVKRLEVLLRRLEQGQSVVREAHASRPFIANRARRILGLAARWNQRPASYPEPPMSVVKTLRDWYASDVRSLEDLLQRNFFWT